MVPIVVSIIITITTFLIGVYVGITHIPAQDRVTSVINKENDKPSTVDYTPYWKVWNIIDEKFVPAGTSTEIASNQERVWKSIQGLTRSLNDPHVVFMPPDDSKVFEDDISGDFEGVGMEIGIRDNVLTVVSPLSGSPAQKAGLLSQDKIIEINGKSTQDMTVNTAVKEIRGKKGSDVEFTVIRDDETQPRTISVTRDTIQIPTIENYLRSDGVYVITLHNFSEKSPVLFRQAIQEFKRSPSNQLVLDLRQNPGGFLGAAVEMASYFLPEGKAVVREDGGQKNKDLNHTFRSKGYNLFDETLQMIVLVDGGSASASEILAGALSEHGIATMVGSQTFGKGSVQELMQITASPKTFLKVTVAHWLTPNGKSISKGGLTPQIEVDRTHEDFEQNLDPQMDRAIELLTMR